MGPWQPSGTCLLCSVTGLESAQTRIDKGCDPLKSLLDLIGISFKSVEAACFRETQYAELAGKFCFCGRCAGWITLGSNLRKSLSKVKGKIVKSILKSAQEDMTFMSGAPAGSIEVVTASIKRLLRQCMTTCAVQIDNCGIEELGSKNITGNAISLSTVKIESIEENYTNAVGSASLDDFVPPAEPLFGESNDGPASVCSNNSIQSDIPERISESKVEAEDVKVDILEMKKSKQATRKRDEEPCTSLKSGILPQESLSKRRKVCSRTSRPVVEVAGSESDSPASDNSWAAEESECSEDEEEDYVPEGQKLSHRRTVTKRTTKRKSASTAATSKRRKTTPRVTAKASAGIVRSKQIKIEDDDEVDSVEEASSDGSIVQERRNGLELWITCPLCSVELEGENDIKLHMRLFHNVHRFWKKYYACKCCLKAFLSPNPKIPSGKLTKGDLDAFKDFVATHASCIREGSRGRTAKDLQQCRFCDSRFMTAGKLMIHEKRQHGKKRKFVCTFAECGIVLSCQAMLIKHFQAEHDNSKFLCGQCLEWLPSPETLKDHMDEHVASLGFRDRVTKDFYQCLLCHHSFKITMVKLHLLNHHGLDRILWDSYSCAHCHEAYQSLKPDVRSGMVPEDEKEDFIKFTDRHKGCLEKPVRSAEQVQKCKFCPETFLTGRTLLEHEQAKHSTEPVPRIKIARERCTVCGASFSLFFNLANHIEAMHSDLEGNIDYECNLCAEKIKGVEEYKEHKKIHMLERKKNPVLKKKKKSSKLMCTRCNRLLRNRSTYKRHHCVDNKTPQAESLLLAHTTQRSDHRNLWDISMKGFSPCLLCDTTFDEPHLLGIHFEEFHDGKTDIKFTCTSCNIQIQQENFQAADSSTGFDYTIDRKNGSRISFPTFQAFCAHHLKSCIPEKSPSEKAVLPLKCGKCLEEFDDNQQFSIHVNEHYGKTAAPCTLCVMIFKDNTSLKVHMKCAHRIVNCFPGFYYCLGCKLPWISERPEVGTGQLVPEDMDAFKAWVGIHWHCKQEPALGPLKCKFCDVSEIKNVLKLIRHEMKNHTKAFPNYCEICGRGYPDSTDLKRHMKSHTNEFQCTECPYKTGIKNHLEDHCQRSHSKERPFVCELCGTTCPTINRLSKHKLSHLTEPTVPCTQCDKLFRSKHHLYNHMYCVHSKRRKPRS